MSRKVGIVGGAGVLGSAMGFHLAVQRLVDEVVLIDIKENLLKAHAMDMEQAVSSVSRTTVRTGEYADLAGCQAVVMCASVYELHATDRLRFLEANRSIVEGGAEQIAKYSPNAVVINATNPVDVFNYALRRLTGMPSRRFIGFSRNDSIRFRWAVAKVLGLPAERIDALVVGEHGPDQVLLFSTVTVDGERVELDNAQRAEIKELVYSWFGIYTALKSGRTSGWTSAVSAAHVVKNVLEGSGEILALSVIPDGEYGLSGLSVGLPVKLGLEGVAAIVELQLTPDETAGLNAAAGKIKQILKSSFG